MTSTNTHLKCNNQPFLLKPIGKDYLWGGNRLNEDFSKGIDMKPLAETWECSTHPHGLSIVGNGIFQGKTLKEVLQEHREFLGKHSEALGELPILIKFIDAKQDLSIQVHPDDEYAKAVEGGQRGKSEFWYILDATPKARIIYGLHHSSDKETIRNSIKNGCFENYLQTIPVKRDDVFYIKSGTIHAIGAGTLVAEIQQNSDLTYRLYDYNRIDKNGKKRELHIDKALDVACLDVAEVPTQPMRVLNYSPGCAVELLQRCQFFQIERILINTERIRDMVSYSTDELSFSVLLCTSGCGVMTYGEDSLAIFRGDCIFVPADSVEIKIHGRLQMLRVSC